VDKEKKKESECRISFFRMKNENEGKKNVEDRISYRINMRFIESEATKKDEHHSFHCHHHLDVT
jgi:hypothetical protein